MKFFELIAILNHVSLITRNTMHKYNWRSIWVLQLQSCTSANRKMCTIYMSTQCIINLTRKMHLNYTWCRNSDCIHMPQSHISADYLAMPGLELVTVVHEIHHISSPNCKHKYRTLLLVLICIECHRLWHLFRASNWNALCHTWSIGTHTHKHKHSHTHSGSPRTRQYSHGI